MKNIRLIALFLIHFTLSLGGFLLLSGWALGTADAEIAGGTSAPTGWLATVVHFGLLQPVAHWVLSLGVVRWWTWAGLIALIALIALNSGVVVAAVWFVRDRIRPSR